MPPDTHRAFGASAIRLPAQNKDCDTGAHQGTHGLDHLGEVVDVGLVARVGVQHAARGIRGGA